MIDRNYEDFQETNVMWMPTLSSDGSITIDKYFVNNMLAGDTDSAYLSIPREFTANKTEDEIVETVDAWCEEANAQFAEYIMAVFNCPSERTGTIAADREAVSDKSLFLTKKRYIMHIVNMEGKKKHQLKIMGVEIKKSDTPPIVKKILMDLVEKILDGYSREDLTRVIEEHRKVYFQSPITEIAKPSGCKTLSKAIKQLEEVGDLHGIHYASRAAIYYNQQCGNRDQKIRPGDKIGIVYITDPKSKYIGYPRDAQNLPDWLFDSVVIDYKANWKTAEKKINNYLTSIGYDMETVNKNIRQELFGFH